MYHILQNLHDSYRGYYLTMFLSKYLPKIEIILKNKESHLSLTIVLASIWIGFKISSEFFVFYSAIFLYESYSGFQAARCAIIWRIACKVMTANKSHFTESNTIVFNYYWGWNQLFSTLTICLSGWPSAVCFNYVQMILTFLPLNWNHQGFYIKNSNFRIFL